MKTSMKRQTHRLDAAGKVLGRLATGIAIKLMGKDKPGFVPYLDGGDFVIVQHVDQMIVTGKKLINKTYFWHTPYIGSLKQESLGKRIKERPERVLRDAVYAMLPKNKIRDRAIKRLTFK